MARLSTTSPAPGSPATTDRPRVAVVVPFHGSETEAVALLDALARIRLRDGDEVVLADNTPEGVLAGVAEDRDVTAVRATGEQSSYYARNVAAEQATAPWLLFVDADCVPHADLVDCYFDPPPADDVGALIGGIVAASGQRGVIAAYARSRGHLEHDQHMEVAERPFGATANLLVRRAAWASVGGFHEGVASGADAEFCWRLQDTGLRLELRPDATVEHRHRESVRGLIRQASKYGAGNAWMNRRYRGIIERPKLVRPLARCVAGVVVWTVGLQPRRALYKAIDAIWFASRWSAYVRSNAAPSRVTPAAQNLVLMTDAFPALPETFIAAEVAELAGTGTQLRVESTIRPPRPDRALARRFPAHYWEDDSTLDKAGDALWLAARHPLRVLRDRRDCRRWAAEEPPYPLTSLAPLARRIEREGTPHIHVHFAAIAALNALRIGRLTGVTFSVTAHAFDIFHTPRNLREKLETAAFVTTGCDYNVAHLKTIAPAAHIERIVMGVDASRFRRTDPLPGGRRVIAVGRLVEKKGFDDLIDAAALLAERGQVERVTIIGDGPQRDELRARIANHGLQDVVELAGWRDPDAVREELERSNLLAMPAVVASDGDRDSMPVVVKEALAMEVFVVATDEVGLPEIVKSGWGRLVPPHDPPALAAAIADLLALPVEERAQMGRAGRAFVIEHCDVARETAKLKDLIARAQR